MSNSTNRFQWKINERIKTKKTIDYFVDIGVYMVLICNFFILWGNSQGMDALVRWPTRLMVSYIFLLAIYLFAEKVTSKKVEKVEALFVGLVAITGICYVLTCKSAVVDKLVQYMCFLMLPGCCVLYKHAGRVKQLKKATYIASACYAVLFTALVFADNSHIAYGHYGLEEVDELTLGFQNPNETAIYLMLTFFVLAAAFFAAGKWTGRAFYGALAIQMYYLTLQTQSRSCIALCTVYLVLALVQRWFRIGTKTLVGVLLLPATILVIMLGFPSLLAEVQFMGEAADTGRILIFNSYFKDWGMSQALLGDFLKYGGSNLHNSFLSLMAMFGVPAAVYYLYNFYKQTMEYKKQIESPTSYMGYVGWVMVMLHGIAEGTLLSAGTVYAGMAGLLLILMLPEEKKE